MAFTIIYSIVDGKGAIATHEVNLPSTVAFADVTLFASEMAQLIVPLIGGRLSRIGIAFSVPLPVGIPTTATATSDVEEGARFGYNTAGGFNTGGRIPTFLEAKILPGTREVDRTDADVLGFLAAMDLGIDLTGVGGSGTIQPSDKRDDDIVSIAFAREDFQNSRRP